MHGRPAAGLRYDLAVMHGDHSHPVLSGVTNADGRADEPLLGGERWGQGEFELTFHVGDYFSKLGVSQERQFLRTVPVRFMITDNTHYHVPLLVSPYGYSTYRGS
jgi:5-hydroxyisourate hydrolase